ncbi:MAG: chemotaxis protein MotB [Candidatus Manganitrophaceae bacterium]|nr:MAG: chemotaxis protein MotB [Candidatus Manganitrophaceae bacterium]
MKWKPQFNGIVLLFLIFWIGGCVAKSRYVAEVSQRESVAARLQEEEEKRAALEKSLEESKTAASQREKELSDKLAGIEQQLAVARESGTKTEQELRDQMLRMKGAFDETDRAQQSMINRLNEALKVTEAEAAQRERELRESESTHKELIGQLQKEITDGSIKITQLKDRLSVEIVDKILFASGSDQVTAEGKGVLKKVSDILKTVKENSIRIEGHTDNVPIGSRLAGKFPSNWELSTSRATQVVRYLSELGVPPEKMSAVGLAEYRPVASNDTPEGKQRNRRIEIVLYPKDLQEIAASVEPPHKTNTR